MSSKTKINDEYFRNNISMHLFFKEKITLEKYESKLSSLQKNTFLYPSDAIPNGDTEKEISINEIEEYVSGDDVCDGIDRKFINRNLDNSELLVVMKDISNENRMVGFALVDFTNSIGINKLTLSLICSNNKEYKNGGHYLMEQLYLIAYLLKLREIELNSVIDSVGFYIKNGYMCNTPQGLCPMKKKVIEPPVRLFPESSKKNSTIKQRERPPPTISTDFTPKEKQEFIELCNSEHGDIKPYIDRKINVNMRGKAMFQEMKVPVLSLAIVSGNLPAVELLIEAGAKVNVQSEIGTTPIMAAIMHYDEGNEASKKIVDLLLAEDLDTSIEDEDGQDVFHYITTSIDDALEEAEDSDDNTRLSQLVDIESRLRDIDSKLRESTSRRGGSKRRCKKQTRRYKKKSRTRKQNRKQNPKI
jgi:hypothetical protein